ncbi:acyl-CoA thioesterase [Rhodococcus aetherivorans]|uniref:acyl-CoA thioesterase n=1 Tax=Rhodococcus aetherivorans TaxID=191292 RepID=UPI0024203B83|nr:acyl-CoA thioesterase domain-containing protein [Rhodococcus aetherivorans]WFS11046.1 thioesterase family protein [Rhodococcus aetherivorans]
MTETEAEVFVTDDTVELREILRVEPLDRDLFRALPVHYDGRPLFGGQIAAQCLLACGATVPGVRPPHSLHGYFLRRGDSARPVVYRVDRDRDGRSYSARRVVALQDGEVLFSMAASFRVRTDGAELDGEPPAPMPPPDECRPIPSGLPLEARVDEWPNRTQFFPTRFHIRPMGGLPPGDVLVHAAALTYMSDFSAGLPKLLAGEVLGPSLDHALWFHDVPKWDGWLRVDYEPGTAGGKRGWYSGAIRDEAGRRIASLAQEMGYRDDDSATTDSATTPG